MALSHGAPAHGPVAHLLPSNFKCLVSSWLEEDTPSFDYGGFVVGESPAEAKLFGKSNVCQNIPTIGSDRIFETFIHSCTPISTDMTSADV